MYSLLRKFLFLLDPETAHTVALKGLNIAYLLGLSRFFASSFKQPCNVMGLKFPNPIGLTAGLDKSGDYVDALAALGFGFIEIGTITPQPQIGNPRPRLFRLVQQEAIINRMGFNNKGVAHAVKQLEKMRYRGILGINIGKNRDTPVENALDDYLFCFRAFWPYASYITVNISSPNTPGLRDLQQGKLLQSLLTALKQEQKIIFDKHGKYVPLVVKIAPDLSAEELQQMAAIFLAVQIDGVIATNTSVSREGILDAKYANETGGLSGRPIFPQSTAVLRELKLLLGDKITLIASGGVMDEKCVKDKIAAGANLVQVYSGFIYRGADIIQN